MVHYPKMSKDEVIIFRTYDSAPGFVPTLHGSFDDPVSRSHLFTSTCVVIHL